MGRIIIFFFLKKKDKPTFAVHFDKIDITSNFERFQHQNGFNIVANLAPIGKLINFCFIFFIRFKKKKKKKGCGILNESKDTLFQDYREIDSIQIHKRFSNLNSSFVKLVTPSSISISFLLSKYTSRFFIINFLFYFISFFSLIFIFIINLFSFSDPKLNINPGEILSQLSLKDLDVLQNTTKSGTTTKTPQIENNNSQMNAIEIFNPILKQIEACQVFYSNSKLQDRKKNSLILEIYLTQTKKIAFNYFISNSNLNS